MGAATMKHIAPAKVGHRRRTQPRATDRVAMRDENERPLPHRRTSALRKIGGLQRVDLRPSTITPLAFRLDGR